MPPPHGDMGLYMQSLERLQTYDATLLCPGHGPPVRDVARKLAQRADRACRTIEHVCRVTESAWNAFFDKLTAAVAAHTDLALAALFSLTHIAGSLVIALAVAEGQLDAHRAFEAAQLDELFQIERWGADPLATQRHEGIAKDIDAAARFLALLEDKRLRGKA